MAPTHAQTAVKGTLRRGRQENNINGDSWLMEKSDVGCYILENSKKDHYPNGPNFHEEGDRPHANAMIAR